jgi:hypothetical protein
MLAALLLAVGIGAALQFQSLLSHAGQLANDERLVLTAIDHVDAIGAELSGLATIGEADARWLDRASALAPKVVDEVTAMRPRARSVEAAAKLQAMGEAAARWTAADPAADETVTGLRTAAAQMRTAEEAAFAADRAAIDQQVVLVPGIAALVWLIGLALLVRLPPAPASAFDMPSQPSLPTSIDGAAPVPSSIDLGAAAELCTALSRVVSSKALPDMLARAAALLDASGVIVWMGAGEELFAATSHGYDPRVISRLGAIPRDAENATAAAWRTGEVRTVPGDMMSNGALVAPMFGPESCIGVVAAEVRHGREDDPATRAVTVILAAQLATVLSAWPAASTAPAAHAAEA